MQLEFILGYFCKNNINVRVNMSVVTDLNNNREEFPCLNLEEVMKSKDLYKSNDWKNIIKRNCKTIILKNLNKNMVSLVRLRGIIYEISKPVLDSVYLHGTRCPIHTVEVIGKSGNKTIVDIIFSTDPSCIKISEKDQNTGILNIKFPNGFSPICYTSPKCQFQYLSAIFRPINLLAIEISPISCTLLWNLPGEMDVKIESEDKIEIIRKQNHKLELVNLEPSTEYKITVFNDKNTETIKLSTHEMTPNEMRKLYKSRKNENELYDISSFSPCHVKYMRKHGILNSEDKVKVKGEFEKVAYMYDCGIVKSGDNCLTDGDCNFYVIPDFENEEEQFICLESMGISHMVHFDRTETYVKYNDEKYTHDSKFRIENHMVSVAKGSIILSISSSSDPLDFPGGASSADQVVSSGDLVVKDILCQNMSQVTEKVSGDTSYGISSFHVYDSSTSSTLECTRTSHGISDNKEEGRISMSVLYTNPSTSVQSLVQTIDTSAECTTFKTTTENSELTSKFGSDGLSFDTNEGNIFFGAAKEFRIHYQEAVGLDPSMLQIQRLSGGSYVSSFVVTSEPP